MSKSNHPPVSSYTPFSFSLQGAAEHTGIPVSTLRLAVKQGYLPAYHHSRKRYRNSCVIRATDLHAFVLGLVEIEPTLPKCKGDRDADPD